MKIIHNPARGVDLCVDLFEIDLCVDLFEIDLCVDLLVNGDRTFGNRAAVSSEQAVDLL